MFERRSLRLPITLGVVLIVTVVLLLVALAACSIPAYGSFMEGRSFFHG